MNPRRIAIKTLNLNGYSFKRSGANHDIYEDLAEYHVHRIPHMGVDECVTDYPDLLCIVSHSQGCSLPLW